MKQKTLEEISAGGVVFRIRQPENSESQSIGKTENQKLQYEFLIGKHSGYHKWVLPKGLVEEGETNQEAAIREVEEEVGVTAHIVGSEPLKVIEYWYTADFGPQQGVSATGETSERRVKKYQEDGAGSTRVHKKVIFYLMEVVADLGKEGWEMEDRKWVGQEEALELLAFETEKEVFIQAIKAVCAPAET